MKKTRKIILIILLISLVGGIVYAATTYLANATEVSYDKNGTTVSVKTELDDLYEKAFQPK